jgi:hypothetical protein
MAKPKIKNQATMGLTPCCLFTLILLSILQKSAHHF